LEEVSSGCCCRPSGRVALSWRWLSCNDCHAFVLSHDILEYVVDSRRIRVTFTIFMNWRRRHETWTSFRLAIKMSTILRVLSFPIFARQFAGVRPLLARQFGPYCTRITLQARTNIQRTLTTEAASVTRAIPRKGGLPFIFTAAGVAGVGLGLLAFTRPQIYCDSPSQPPYSGHPPPLPTSTVNLYELSFGTICGLCAGIFIKKGAKAVAFILGGLFVLLQYLGSASVVRIDWAKIGSRFENLFYTKDPVTGNKKAPNVYSLWNWLVDFLTANFQQRASFLAGLALGLRVG